MSDLENRLRDAARARSADYEPSSELPGRIQRRVRQRQGRSRALAGSGALAVVAVVAVLLVRLPDDRDGVVTIDPAATSTSAPDGSTSTTSIPTTFPTVIDAATPLDPGGLGPIRAGLTLRQAQEVSGRTITPSSFEDFGGYCYFASIDGVEDVSVLVLPPDRQVPVTDPLDGVIGSISVRGGRATDSGIRLGATEAQVRAAHPDLVAEPHFYVAEGAYLYVWPDGGADGSIGMRYVLDGDRVVVGIDAGLPDAVQLIEGCA